MKNCIESVIKYTNQPYRLIIVDDGSNEETRDYLAGFAKGQKSIVLIRNETGNGYTIAANMGLRVSSPERGWNLNPIPNGYAVEDVGQMVEKYSGCIYPPFK